MNKNKYLIKEKLLNIFLENILDNKIWPISESLLQKNEESVSGFTSKYTLELAPSEVEDILDELTLLLTSKGLDEHDEPNSLGLSLESLIDIFSPYNQTSHSD